ncbi:MAG: hypothetical protein IPP94_02460 [Ignavibacteria bacterium]|nr:hypothetical protein [Ignavibacteria bacterium]
MAGGLLLALLPLLPGIVKGRTDWLFAGYIMSLFTPFQSGVIAASLLVGAVLLLRHGRVLRGSLRPPGTLFFLALYLLFLCAQWVAGYGTLHTPLSIGSSLLFIVATPVAVLLLARAAAKEGPASRWMDLAASIIVAEALVIVLLPLLIGKPALLGAVVNGVLKPVYTVLGVSHTFPWYDPDWNQGSITIVNYSAVVMTLGAAHVFARFVRRRTLRDALAFVLLVFAAFMGENAMAMGAAAAACAVTAVGALLFRVTRGAWRGAGKRHARAALLTVLIATGLWGFLEVTYLGDGRFAKTQKGRYYGLAYQQLTERPARLCFGYGAGAYGSRVANGRLAGDPYLIRQQLAAVYGLPLSDTAFAVSDFSTDFSAASRHPAEWIGASQGLMMSGLIATVFENGLLGLLLLLAILWPALRASGALLGAMHADAWRSAAVAIFALSFLACLSVFYNYNEIPTIVAILLLPVFLPILREPFSQSDPV